MAHFTLVRHCYIAMAHRLCSAPLAPILSIAIFPVVLEAPQLRPLDELFDGRIVGVRSWDQYEGTVQGIRGAAADAHRELSFRCRDCASSGNPSSRSSSPAGRSWLCTVEIFI